MLLKYLFGHQLLKLDHNFMHTEPFESRQAVQKPAACFHKQQVDLHLPPDAWMDHLKNRELKI